MAMYSDINLKMEMDDLDDLDDDVLGLGMGEL